MPLDLEHIRRKYKDKMLQIAFVVSQWSAEPEGQRHGCVLAMFGKYIVATGFNGKCRFGADEVTHAEWNCLLNANAVGIDTSTCVAYITKRPCEHCLDDLKRAKVQAVFWLQDAGGREAMWTCSQSESEAR